MRNYVIVQQSVLSIKPAAPLLHKSVRNRLARSTRDLLNVLDRLGKDGVSFKSLRETAVDTTTAQGRLVVSILAAISEFEREIILSRISEGRKRARRNGIKFGRKPKLTDYQRQEALERLAGG